MTRDDETSIADYMRDRIQQWIDARVPFSVTKAEILYPMVPEVKARWVAGLRSGDYEQTVNYLKRSLGQQGQGHVFGYCCWGVLCEIEGVPSRPIQGRGDHDIWIYEFDDLPARDDTQIPRAFWTSRLWLHQAVVNGLAQANDADYLFPEIAGWVEENL